MKKIRTLILCTAILPLIQSTLAQGGMPYEEIPFKLAFKTTKKNGVDYIAMYGNSEKELDFSKANFRMESPTGEIIKLTYDTLSEVPIDELSIEDIEMLDNGKKIRLWIPKDPVKYKGWTLKHDFEKGAMQMTHCCSILSSKSVEEKRKEYTEKLKREKEQKEAKANKD